jgi:hypothetical protein
VEGVQAQEGVAHKKAPVAAVRVLAEGVQVLVVVESLEG